MIRLSQDRARAKALLPSIRSPRLELARDSPEVSRVLRTPGRRVADAFEKDFPIFLLAVASSVRAGLDPVSAVKAVGETFDGASAVAQEVRGVIERIRTGADEGAAMLQFGSRSGHPDASLFGSAFFLAQQQGASLAPSLKRLAAVIRARQSFRRKTRAAVATQRLSGYCIVGFSALIASFHYLHDPAAAAAALTDPVGKVLVFGGFGLLALGAIWLTRLGSNVG